MALGLPSVALAIVLLLLCGACRATRNSAGAKPVRSEDTIPKRSIEDVIRMHTPELMKLSGVIGTGQGERLGRPIILVLVERRTHRLEAQIPRRLDGYEVEIRETGQVKALDRR
jgi:hypothetical protein